MLIVFYLGTFGHVVVLLITSKNKQQSKISFLGNVRHSSVYPISGDPLSIAWEQSQSYSQATSVREVMGGVQEMHSSEGLEEMVQCLREQLWT